MSVSSRSDVKYYKFAVYRANTLIPFMVSKDGLICKFRCDDIEPYLRKLPKDEIGWFFNSTRDRYCAERIGKDWITVNPSKVFEIFRDYPDDITREQFEAICASTTNILSKHC